MNDLNDTGEFQEVESNYGGKFSHVPSQPARIPSPRSTPSGDKRLPLETWNTSGLLENVFGNHFSTFGSSQNHYQGIPPFMTPNAAGEAPELMSTGRLVARNELISTG